MAKVPYRIKSDLIVEGDISAENLPLLITTTHISQPLAPGESEDFQIECGNAYHLLTFTSSFPCWLRVYGNDVSRSLDTRTEPGGTYPPAGSEFYAELVTLDPNETIRLSPVAVVQADELGLSYIRIVNTGFSTETMQIELKTFSIF